MKSLQSFFHFTRRERRGIITLMVIIGLCCMMPWVLRMVVIPETRVTVDTSFITHIRADSSRTYNYTHTYQKRRYDTERYPRFRSYPSRPVYQKYEHSYRQYDPRPPVVMTKVVLDINQMDSLSLVRLPGIGPALARRILAFRQKLGGFYDVDQIKETYGLPDSTFQFIRKYLKNSDIPVQQIDINAAGVEEMKSHPLLRYQLAKAIVAYREQHGNFARVEDIRQIYTITGEMYNRVSPYLVVH